MFPFISSERVAEKSPEKTEKGSELVLTRQEKRVRENVRKSAVRTVKQQVFFIKIAPENKYFLHIYDGSEGFILFLFTDMLRYTVGCYQSGTLVITV